MAKVFKLNPGEKFRAVVRNPVTGNDSPVPQQVFTLKSFYAIDGKRIPWGTRDWVGCVALATMITLHDRGSAPEQVIPVGSTVVIKGYGRWTLAAPGRMDGDDCNLLPLNKTAERFAAARPPRNY